MLVQKHKSKLAIEMLKTLSDQLTKQQKEFSVNKCKVVQWGMVLSMCT